MLECPRGAGGARANVRSRSVPRRCRDPDRLGGRVTAVPHAVRDLARERDAVAGDEREAPVAEAQLELAGQHLDDLHPRAVRIVRLPRAPDGLDPGEQHLDLAGRIAGENLVEHAVLVVAVDRPLTWPSNLPARLGL